MYPSGINKVCWNITHIDTVIDFPSYKSPCSSGNSQQAMFEDVSTAEKTSRLR